MYKVIKGFHDLQDSVSTKSGTIYHEYKVGDVFPREGKKVDENRLKELAGKDNKRGVPLINEMKEETPAKK